MTNEEFSNEFDVLYNNITSNQAPGLDEYEKSVFLTKAQDEILKSYFNPKTNKIQEGFDGNQRRQIDFSSIVRSKLYTEDSDFNNTSFDPRPNAKAIDLPTDILMILNEYVDVNREDSPVRLVVVPITFTEYNRLTSKPYKYPLKNSAWRLITNDGGQNSGELIVGPNDTITKYNIRYVKRPQPIILTDLEDDLTIGGPNSNKRTECELDPILHPELLQRAIELAKATYIGDLTSQVALGQTSQTNIGMLTQSK